MSDARASLIHYIVFRGDNSQKKTLHDVACQFEFQVNLYTNYVLENTNSAFFTRFKSIE